MRDGWIKLHRTAFEHELFTKPYCRGFAWFWLVSSANFKPSRYDVFGTIIEIERGQLCASFREIADAWGWKKDAVARYMTRLKTATMITTESATGRSRDKTLITIVNYEVYQTEENGPDILPATDPSLSTETAPRQHRDTIEEREEKKEETYMFKLDEMESIPRVESEFKEWWTFYPRKDGKLKALDAFRNAIEKAPLQYLIEGAKLYAESVAGSETRKIKMAQGWLNDERWTDQPPPSDALKGFEHLVTGTGR